MTEVYEYDVVVHYSVDPMDARLKRVISFALTATGVLERVSNNHLIAKCRSIGEVGQVLIHLDERLKMFGPTASAISISIQVRARPKAAT